MAQQNIPLDKIKPSPFQNRRDFNKEKLSELADSLIEHDQLQNIVVRKIGDDQYELIAGERRWRAAGLAGIAYLSANVVNVSDKVARELVLIENIQREDLNPIEAAKGIAALKEENGYTQEELAEKLSISRPAVANLLRLLTLTPLVQSLLKDGLLSKAHGKILAALPAGLQNKLGSKAADKGAGVKELERMIKRATSHDSKEGEGDLSRLERLVSERTGANAAITFSGGKGSLRLDYSNLDTLQGLLDQLGVKYDS